MARWQPGAGDRLIQAALELFAEQGFASTTVPQITERAGLTTRTFYRHFRDKREVLFGPAHDPEVTRAILAQAPEGLSTAGFLAWGLELLAGRFAPYRQALRAAQPIIDSDASLRERALAKRASLTAATEAALGDRGLAPDAARLVAETSIAAFYLALGSWLTEDVEEPIDRLALAHLDVLSRELAGVPGVLPAPRTTDTVP